MPASTPRGVPYPLATDPLSAFPADVAQPLATQVDTLMGTLTTHGTHLDELDDTTQSQGLALETLSSAVTNHGTQLDALPTTIDARIAAGLAPGGAIKVADDATLAGAKTYTDAGVAQINKWFLRGTGSPVGVVTPASAGVQYVDLQATCGARIWISTGTSSGSWKVVDGDTGKRNITSLLINGWAASSAVVQRVNRFATLQAADLRVADGGAGGSLFAALNGFALPTIGTSVIGFTRGSSSTAAAQASVWSGSLTGTLILEPNASFVSPRTALLSWPTNDTWPTSLPGTPA